MIRSWPEFDETRRAAIVLTPRRLRGSVLTSKRLLCSLPGGVVMQRGGVAGERRSCSHVEERGTVAGESSRSHMEERGGVAGENSLFRCRVRKKISVFRQGPLSE